MDAFSEKARVTPERLAAFQREWNSNQGFVRMLPSTRIVFTKSRLATKALNHLFPERCSWRGHAGTPATLDNKEMMAEVSSGQTNSRRVKEQQSSVRSYADPEPAKACADTVRLGE